MKKQRFIIWLVISVILWLTPAYMLARICDGSWQSDKNTPADQITQPTTENPSEFALLVQK